MGNFLGSPSLLALLCRASPLPLSGLAYTLCPVGSVGGEESEWTCE